MELIGKVWGTNLLDILTCNIYLAQESIKGGIRSLVAPSPSAARPTSFGVTAFFGQCVNPPARNSDRDKSVANLAHNDTSVGPSLSLSPNGGEFCFPVRPDLI